MAKIGKSKIFYSLATLNDCLVNLETESWAMQPKSQIIERYPVGSAQERPVEGRSLTNSLTKGLPPAGDYIYSPFLYRRFCSRVVKVGNLAIGGDNPIRLQSMTTADTMDTEAVVAEVIGLIQAGSEMVRITAPGPQDAENLAEIRRELEKRGYNIPLIADIHYAPRAAMIALEHVEKVRINPGNFADRKRFQVREYSDAQYQEELERVGAVFLPLVRRAKTLRRALRIGSNHGSLSDRIMNRFGDTALGMVESAMEFLRFAAEENFYDIIVSMKASNPQVMVQAYRLLVARFYAEGMDYPLHLGVTEAGLGSEGRIKSALGICALLNDGLGDTIRVSLTEDAVKEIPAAKNIANLYQQLAVLPNINQKKEAQKREIPKRGTQRRETQERDAQEKETQERDAQEKETQEREAQDREASKLISCYKKQVDPYSYRRLPTTAVNFALTPTFALGGSNRHLIFCNLPPISPLSSTSLSSVASATSVSSAASAASVSALTSVSSAASLSATSSDDSIAVWEEELRQLRDRGVDGFWVSAAEYAGYSDRQRSLLGEGIPWIYDIGLLSDPEQLQLPATALAMALRLQLGSKLYARQIAIVRAAQSFPLFIDLELTGAAGAQDDLEQFFADALFSDALFYRELCRSGKVIFSLSYSAGNFQEEISSAQERYLLPHIYRLFIALLSSSLQLPLAPLLLRGCYHDRETALYRAPAMLGALLLDGIGDAILLEGGAHCPSLSLDILQAARLRLSKAEFISCPSCGRTLFDLQDTTARIQAATAHLKGVKIAVMGCIVNGPGEMADADFGYVGAGVGRIHLYRQKELVKANVPADRADQELVSLIREHGMWVDP